MTSGGIEWPATEHEQELRLLRSEFVSRFEAHPPSTWSAALFSAVIAVIDLQFGHPRDAEDVNSTGRPLLRVVR